MTNRTRPGVTTDRTTGEGAPAAPTITHKLETGRSYRGIPIHAAGGLHEHVVGLVRPPAVVCSNWQPGRGR